MNFKFHIIKNPLHLVLAIIICIFLYLFLIILFGNIHYPALLTTLFIFLLYLVRKPLFWKLLDIEINTETSTIQINEQLFSFKEIKYYQHSIGQFMSNGIGRQVMILYLNTGRKIQITPCKSSEFIAEYDSFFGEMTKCLKAESISTYTITLAKFGRMLLKILLITTLACVAIWLLLSLI